MIVFNLLIICVICVFVCDYSPFISDIGAYLTRILHSKVALSIPKPFSCGLCMTLWTSLIYLLIANAFTFINLLIVILFCALTPEILHALYTLRDIADKVLTVIDNALHWIK